MSNELNKVTRGFTHYIEIQGALSPRIPAPTVPKLNPGVYNLVNDDQNNSYFVPRPITTDRLLNLTDTVSQKVINEVQTFWEQATRDRFDAYGLVYKRGILMYGAPGTGKTCTVIQIMEKFVRDGGIVLLNPNCGLVADAIIKIREIEPQLRVLVVFEEVDRIVNTESFLTLLDGEDQVGNVVYLATTNYLDRIPPRVKSRPSRFATVIEVGPPSPSARRQYLQSKLLAEDMHLLDKWVEETEGLVIDQIKDTIISVCCFGQDLSEAIKKVRELGYEEEDEDDQDDEQSALDDYIDQLTRKQRQALQRLR